MLDDDSQRRDRLTNTRFMTYHREDRRMRADRVEMARSQLTRQHALAVVAVIGLCRIPSRRTPPQVLGVRPHPAPLSLPTYRQTDLDARVISTRVIEV